MIPLSRRAILAGGGLAAVAACHPALARDALMPPARPIRTNGITLSVRAAGAGTPIVLLHGFPGLGWSWRHQIPALTEAGYRVIVPDLRGYGGSDAPAAVEAYDIVQLTSDVIGLLDALGIERALVMGHDWGGLLAWQLPLFHPDRIAGVIGVNTPFVPDWMLWLHPDLVKAALPAEQRFVADPAVDPIVQMRQVYRADMYVLMFQDGHRADEAMNADRRGSLRNAFRKNLMTSAEWDDLPPEVAHMVYYGQPILPTLPGSDVLSAAELDRYAEGYARHGFTPPINWYRNLSRNWRIGRTMDQTIRVPALIISGEHDVVLRPSMAEGMEHHVPDLERHVVADSWHWTPEDQPAAVNRIATDWLRRKFPA